MKGRVSVITGASRGIGREIARRLAALYRQLTLRPARLMTTSAPSICRDHSPSDSASQCITRHGVNEPLVERVSTTTSCSSF